MNPLPYSTRSLCDEGLAAHVPLPVPTPGVQAMFAALNIAYEEPERRSLVQFYLSALAFTVLGILGGLAGAFVADHVAGAPTVIVGQ